MDPEQADGKDVHGLESRGTMDTAKQHLLHSWTTSWSRAKNRVYKKNLLSTLKEERTTIVVTGLCVVGLLVLQLTGWSHLPKDGWITLWATFMALAAMVKGIADPDICLFFATTILLVAGIITPREAFEGFSNDSIVTIALMLAITSGIEATGILEYVGSFVLGRSAQQTWLGQARMFSIVAVFSAFMNNTPLVAVMIPIIEKWCKKYNALPSKYMMPLSYAAILGGLCTIIGTSTNLIVKGLANKDFPEMKIGFFEVGIVGAPMAVAGMLYVCFASPFLLPVRETVLQAVKADPRKYTVGVVVSSNYPFIGKSVEEAGLRGLKGLFIVDIQRSNKEMQPPGSHSVVAAPPPNTTILEGDFITFAGEVDSVHSLLNIEGLVPASTLDFSEESNFGGDRVLAEVVLSLQNPLLGQTVRDSHFRTHYNASIIAIHRNGHTLGGSIGGTELQGGDTLLLETTREFLKHYRYHRDFLLVGDVHADPFKAQKEPLKMMLSVGMFVAMIVLNTTDTLPLSTTALLVMFAMFMTGVLTVDIFRESIPGMILLTVAGAFGIAKAMDRTGVATQLGKDLVAGFRWMGEIGPLFAIYLATVILTSLLSNGAAVTVMYPIAKEVAIKQLADPKAYFFVIMLGASAAFSTPIGYQTNLMVAGPGGYEFLDFTKFGVPLQLICAVFSVGLSYLVWLR